MDLPFRWQRQLVCVGVCANDLEWASTLRAELPMQVRGHVVTLVQLDVHEVTDGRLPGCVNGIPPKRLMTSSTETNQAQ